MISFRRCFYVFLVVSGCAEDRAPDATTLPEITPVIRVDQPFHPTRGTGISVRFERTHPLHPEPFALDRSDFPTDFKPFVRVTCLAGEAPVGSRDIPFCLECAADGWLFASVQAADVPPSTTALRCDVVSGGSGKAYDFHSASVRIPVDPVADTKAPPPGPNPSR